MKIYGILLLLALGSCISQSFSQSAIKVDAGIRYQEIDGFGVNINAAWWLDGEYRNSDVVKPAIDLLIDSLGATIFRVVIEEMDWETVNDDNDARHFNWDYFNRVFTSPRFNGVWNTLHYLNQRGITDKLMISFMGAPSSPAPLTAPNAKKSWMGNTNHTVDASMEDEFVESIAALLYYAKNTEKIKFTLVSPMNETDIVSGTKGPEHPDGIVEGPNMPDPVQYARILHKLAEKLDKIGLNDIRFVTPDAAGDQLFNACFDEIIKDPVVMNKIAHWGVHQYGKDARNYLDKISDEKNPVKTYWVTETAGIKNLAGQLDDDASSQIFWDGFDCDYQHARRNGYGNEPPNDWVFWEGEKGKPLIAYDKSTGSWTPRKQFYEFAQLFRYIRPGAIRIGASVSNNDLIVYAYLNPDGRVVIVGYNKTGNETRILGNQSDVIVRGKMRLYLTNAQYNLKESELQPTGEGWQATIPGESVFTITYSTPTKPISHLKPEPDDWYAGDMHVHRNCGDATAIWTEDSLHNMMEVNNLAVVTLLADIGNGEVKDSKTDPGKVNGADLPQSEPGRIIHYDAEWHFDPAGVTFENKALGGHLVLLGLKEAHPMWKESTYNILEWGRKQNAVQGFCHMQYLNDPIQNELTCCIPIDFPVEIAFGTVDFLAEDVWLNDAAINAYYRILNCGFRPGWCAGTDFPCNNAAPLGSLLTYVQVKEPLTYSGWIHGIKNGRTVVTTNGHKEFLDLNVGDSATPGDEIHLNSEKNLQVKVTWTSVENQNGSIELVCNGKIVARQNASAGPGNPAILTADLPVDQSSWICARRMNEKGHQSHTAPVYITVGNKPVRASAGDAEYFVAWIDNISKNIRDGGPWRKYFREDIEVVRARYKKAEDIYRKIAFEAKGR
ncbi:MAG TPA: CehA/McbA family metallohydrolase [Bacteroidales bacterium]|nr:CehA/McbA family metallohydrolase [Bacteroidales bacterium]